MTQSYESRVLSQLRTIRESGKSKAGIESIIKFDRENAVNNLTWASRSSYLYHLKYLLFFLGKKKFQDATKEDLIEFFNSIKKEDGTPVAFNTMRTYKIDVKKFYKWLEGENEFYPKKVRWIKMYEGKKKIAQRGLEVFLTRADVKIIIEAVDSFKHKTFLSVLYDSGARIGELLPLRFSDITFDKYGAVLRLEGKTGLRKVRLQRAGKNLKEWIESHPFRDMNDSFVWTLDYRPDPKRHILKEAVYTQLKKIREKVNIGKPMNPHAFRHAKLMHLRQEGWTREDRAAFAGHSRFSRMPELYEHTDYDQVIRKMTAKMGGKELLKEIEEEEKTMLSPVCPRCGNDNRMGAKFCDVCSHVLDSKTALNIERWEERTAMKIMERLIGKEKVREYLRKHPEERESILLMKKEVEKP